MDIWMNESSESVTFNIFISPSFPMNPARLQSIDNGQSQHEITAS